MSEEQKKKLVTRREMLRLTGATGIGLLATACGGGAAPTVKQQLIVRPGRRVATVLGHSQPAIRHQEINHGIVFSFMIYMQIGRRTWLL